MAKLSPEEAAQYLCGQEQGGQVFGTSYHGVLFRFKRRDGGAHGLLWTQEAGQWKPASYQVFEMWGELQGATHGDPGASHLLEPIRTG